MIIIIIYPKIHGFLKKPSPPLTLLGSLCKKDSIENVETAVGLITKVTILYVYFLVHFFTFPSRSWREISLCDGFWMTKKSGRRILFFSFNIWKKKKEIFSAITVFDAKAPYCWDPTRVLYMCCRTNKVGV